MGFRKRREGIVPAIAVLTAAATLTSTAAQSSVPDLADEQIVVHTSIVFRHGERSRLVKTGASEFGVNAGVSLTARGEFQGYLLGTELRNRYVKSEGGNVTTIVEGVELYDSDRVQIESSGYDRTLETAEAVALGLYPPGSIDPDERNTTFLPDHHIIVPIHSEDPENDPVILAHDLCPVYTDNWQEFYRTTEFQDKQYEAAAWIEELYDLFVQEEGAGFAGSVPCFAEVEGLYEFELEMHAPYNLWDCATILDNAGESYAINQINITPPPTSTDLETSFEYLEHLVFWIEDRKYTADMAGRMLGGLYITNMMTRFAEVIEHIHSGRQETVGRFPGLHLTAGHYPTLKGIEAALDIGGLYGIPEPTSHLAFELIYNNTADWTKGEEDFSVRILYQDGVDETTLRVLQLGVIFAADDDGFDSSVDYNNRVRDDMLWSTWTYVLENLLGPGSPAVYDGGQEEWCGDCQTQAVDTCVRLNLVEMTEKWEDAVASTEQVTAEKKKVDDGIEGVHLSLMSLFGVIFGVGVGFCLSRCLERRARKKTGGLFISGNSGLEGWTNGHGHGHHQGNGSTKNNRNGVFRLGGGGMNTTPTKHLQLADRRAMSAHTATDYDNSMDAAAAEMGDPSKIPAFASASGLGEPVPFPQRGPPSSTLRSVKTPLSPAGDTGGAGNGDYLVSPVPDSNGVDHGFGEKGLQSSTTDVGGTWDVNGHEETWGTADGTTEVNGAPYN